MRGALPSLPISEVLEELALAVRERGHAVLQAPPGAGKTTQVPLKLLADAGIKGRIVMLEPRRVAARAAAERLADLLGEPVGQTVGYRMRGDSVPGTGIEVITEGILTRMLQSDPELAGIGCVIFDEFHERALQADLGLALCLEVRGALRPDLALVVMSATLEAAPVAALMGDAPVITSEGRAFEVAVEWLDRALGPGTMTGPAYHRAVADLVRKAVSEQAQGDVLVFLPGQREISAVQGLLKGLEAELTPLYGGLPFAAQRRALAPGAGRKIVLSTSIAETSLTIPGVRVVVDGGRARRARLDPGSGMSRLVTERVTRAEAVQRQGRAGRVAQGACYRLWTRGEEGGLAAFAPPEIEMADLVPLALELAAWGTGAPEDLPFLTAPNAGGFAAARDLLAELGALDDAGRLTDAGRAMARLPVHPRLARMLIAAGPGAAGLAALMEARDPVSALAAGPPPVDISLRLEALRDLKGFEARRPLKVNRSVLTDIRSEAARLSRQVSTPDAGLSTGAQAALAYPDRIALRRKGDAPRYHLSGGSGAVLPSEDPLAGQRLLVAVDLDGDRREARVRRAVALSEADLREVYGARIAEHRVCAWSRRTGEVEARIEERFGKLVLNARNWTDAPDEARGAAFLEAVRDQGLERLNWSAAAAALRARVEWVNRSGAGLPDVGDAALLAALEQWLLPWLSGLRSWAEVRKLDLAEPLRMWLGRDALAELDRLTPSHFTAPTGTRVRIDYSGEVPEAQVRLQEVFGLATHPVVGADRQPLLLTLLSPARRPVQTTADLPGFWVSSYADVRKDMRGRYPRHPWPDDPLAAAPTRRAKPRGT